MAVAMISLSLAVALTYVVGDFYATYMPSWLAWVCHALVCLVLYRITNHYLKGLKE